MVEKEEKRDTQPEVRRAIPRHVRIAGTTESFPVSFGPLITSLFAKLPLAPKSIGESSINGGK